MEVPYKTKNRTTIWSCNPTPRHISRENHNSERYMHPSVHCSTIHKSQDYCVWNVKVLVAQSCPTLCDPMDCSLPGSSVYWILQARILELVAIPFSRGSSRPRDWTHVSCIAGRFFTVWATSEAPVKTWKQPKCPKTDGWIRSRGTCIQCDTAWP